MADNSVLTEAGQFEVQFERSAAKIRCAMPGTIVAFDPETQRASVAPGSKLKVVQGADVSYTALPNLLDVPVVVPYGFSGKVLLTFPIRPGDPCLLVFSDREIDNYLKTGRAENTTSTSNNDTTSTRTHHLSDAICIPGLIANPQAVPEWNMENIELRDFDRKNYISLGPEGIEISDGEASWKMSGGAITIDAPAGTETTSPTNRITGTVTADELKLDNGTSFRSHTHTGVQTGSGDTGSPNEGS